ncbi:WYL domain-containing protein [Zobellella aerophila]|uniref:WYL domain-containing protein n=1 Tax=Zobellella aerophila TaxID=870480 RepID=A0ABP6V817_9GAMM
MQYSQYIKPAIASDTQTISVTDLASKRLKAGAFSHPQWLRLCYIERQLLWERRLTTTMLMETFGISRPQAQKDIKLYQQLAPKALKPYQLSIPYHQPTESFEPVLLSEADLQWQAIEEYAPPIAAHTTEMPMLIRRHNLRVLARLLSAIEHQRSIEAVVATMSSPKGRGRRLMPTAIAFVNNRYHVRAFCWDNMAYRDFLIGRFKSTPKVVKPSKGVKDWGDNAPAFERCRGVPPESDAEWEQMIELELRPNPHLSQDQQALIVTDYELEHDRGLKRIVLRKPLIGYFLVDNRIPASEAEYKFAVHENPKAWPVFAFTTDSNRPAHKLGF